MSEFQYYKQPITTTKPSGFIDVDTFLKKTMDPKDELKMIFHYIAEAEKAGNQKYKAELKQKHLYYFTPCVNVAQKRNYENITSFTGLLVLDFDHINNAEEFKWFLYNEYPQIIAVWLSPSRKGIKALVKIPVVNTVDEFKEYFFGIANEMQIYDGFDATGQNPILPLFQSWDEDLLYHSDPETWTTKGFKESNFVDVGPVDLSNIDVTDKHKNRVVNIIKSAFSNITDVGHWPLRGISIATGGYIASGYIDQFEGLSLLYQFIDNHQYLKLKAKTYKKTAEWGVNIGKSKPIVLD